MNTNIVSELSRCFPAEDLLTKPEDLMAYSYDGTPMMQQLPLAAASRNIRMWVCRWIATRSYCSKSTGTPQPSMTRRSEYLRPTFLANERNPDEIHRVHQAVAEIFEYAVKLGGTISGEHGIGLTKKSR